MKEKPSYPVLSVCHRPIAEITPICHPSSSHGPIPHNPCEPCNGDSCTAVPYPCDVMPLLPWACLLAVGIKFTQYCSFPWLIRSLPCFPFPPTAAVTSSMNNLDLQCTWPCILSPLSSFNPKNPVMGGCTIMQ
jgi:hypothetical protein